MTSPHRATLVALLAAGDPVAAARAAGVAAGGRVTYRRGPAEEDRLIDGDTEGSLDAHRAAHALGRPSEAAVAYGHGVDAGRIADRLLALAELSRETGLLRAVCPVPADGAPERPGSWGVEDLTIVAVARLALPDVPVRPHWRRLGAAACQVAVAFGADEWELPEDDPADPEHLASAVGATAEPR